MRGERTAEGGGAREEPSEAESFVHDLKNILAAIGGNLEMCRSHLDTRQAGFPHLRSAEAASRQALALAEHWLARQQGGGEVEKTVSVVRTVRDSIACCAVPGRCRIRFEAATDTRLFHGDPLKLGQAVNNLLANAVDFSPPNGEVRVSLRTVSPEEAGVEGADLYIEIAVEDHGPGIDPETDPEAMVSKSGGRRSLGLRSIHAWLRKVGGLLVNHPGAGGGTRFLLFLPGTAGIDPAAAGVQERPEEGLGLGSRILVLDDDAMVRQIVGEMLRFEGCEVFFAREGAEALRVYRRESAAGRPFDLVILDLSLPSGPGGLAVFEEMRAFDPKVRAVVSSGRPNDPVLRNFRRHGFFAKLDKPFSLHDIVVLLGRLQGRPPGAPETRSS